MAKTNAQSADDSLRKVNKNLNDAIKQLKAGSNAGIRKVAIAIERSSKQRVPREYGNLVNSGYHKAIEPGKYEVGFTAAYAVHVHENLEMKLKGKPRPSGKGTYWGPKGEPRFLANAVTEVTPQAAAMVAGEAELKRKKQ